MSIVTVLLLLFSSVLIGMPAQAASQPLFGTTGDVTIYPAATSLFGGTAYAPPSGGGAVVTLGAAQLADVDFVLREGATIFAACTVSAGATGCGSSLTLPVGSHNVTADFTQSAVTVSIPATLVGVDNVAPTVALEWQDASGAWLDGSGAGVLLHGATAARCVVTNNSNAPMTFNSFTGTTTYVGGGPDAVSLTGTLAAGATGEYALWSGSANQSPSAICSGSVAFPDGTANGGGTSGGVIALTGSFSISPSPAPGVTVTVTGTALVPPAIQSFPVTLDGVAVAGSPGLTVPPNFDLSVDVAIPSSLAPGTHVIAVHSLYGGRDVVLAQFAFTVAAQAPTNGPAATGLAATGVDMMPTFVVGGVLVLLGAVLLLTLRRRSAA